MRRNRLLSLLLLVLCLPAIAHGNNFKFYDINAELLPKGVFKYSIFRNASYGIGENINLSAHPLMLFLSPSVELKHGLFKNEKLTVSGLHELNYPTILLRLLSAKGTGGFISPEFNIPHMLSLRNSVAGTMEISSEQYFSALVGFEFAVNNSKLDTRTSIDLPIVSPRSAVYYNNFGFNIAFAMEGRVSDDFNYLSKIELFAFPFVSEKVKVEYDLGHQDIFLEFTGVFIWKMTKTAYLTPGLKLTYGAYPFGTQWHLFPVVDFVKWIE